MKNRKQNKASQKKPLLPNIDKRWFLVGAAVLVLVAGLIIALIRFYAEPGDAVVARAGNIRVRASELEHEISNQLQSFIPTYIAMFPEDTEFNFDRVFDGEKTFGRIVREEAAKNVALYKLLERHATRQLSADISRVRPFNIDDILMVIAHIVMEEQPSEAAMFIPYKREVQTEDDIRTTAQSVLQRLQAGEDFTTLRATYCEDPGQPPDGYFFVEGAMVPEFFDATMALEIGGMSGLVRSHFGYHIILRTEPGTPDPFHVMRFPGQEPHEDEYILGAKHILFRIQEIVPIDEMMYAVYRAFETRFEEMNLRFTDALDDVPLDY